MAGTSQPEVHRGLKDLCFDRSPTTFIDGRAGELRYRGYSIHDLAARSSFEETAYLLLHGELPTASELAAFDAALKEARRLPPPSMTSSGRYAMRIPWTCFAPRYPRSPRTTRRRGTTPSRPPGGRGPASPRKCR